MTTPDAYADLDQFRLYLRAAAVLDDADDPDTALEILALEAGARAIDRACNRDFRVADTASARYFTPTGWRWQQPRSDYILPGVRQHHILPIDDVADPSTMVVEFDATGNGDYTVATTAYRVGPANAPARGLPYSHLIFNLGVYPPIWDDSVRVTVPWGWAATPSTIVNANLLQAGRFLKRRDSLFGVAGSPDMGNELRLLSKLDPDVAVMVAAYRRNWGAV